MAATRRISVIALTLLTMASYGWANAQGALACSVAVDYTQSAQDGTVVATEAYQSEFVLQSGVDFVDDFSTPTRQKVFSASIVPGRARTLVTINYFNDVSTFNTVDFNAQLTLVNNQFSESVSGDQTFSTSSQPLSGHYTTQYTLTCRRQG